MNPLLGFVLKIVQIPFSRRGRFGGRFGEMGMGKVGMMGKPGMTGKPGVEVVELRGKNSN